MKRTFWFISFILLAWPAFSQTKKALLIKAHDPNPAAYVKQLRLAPKIKNADSPINDEADNNPDTPPKLAPRPGTGGMNPTGNTFSETNGNDLQLTSTSEPVLSALTRINMELANSGGPDPMVAAGEKTLLVSNSGSVRFFDKATGKLLLAAGVTNLFQIFLSQTINGAANPNFVSNFYDIPEDVPYWCSKSVPCKTATPDTDPETGKNLPCPDPADDGLIEEAYDTRVYYQKETKRFVIVSALRNSSARSNHEYNEDETRDCEQYLIRLVAIAVSRSENPDDGFYFYRTGENNYRDWPNAVLDKDYLMIAHKGGDSKSNGHSIVTVYNFNQMKDGYSGPLDAFSILQNDANATPASVIPVTNLLTNYRSQVFFFFENKGNGIAKIWYIKKPAVPATIFQNPPVELTVAGQINAPGATFSGGASAGIVFYDKFIYTVSHQHYYDAGTSKKDGNVLNFVRIRVFAKSNGEYEVSDKPADGFEFKVFENTEYSFTDASIAIDAFHNVAIQFLRMPRNKNATEMTQVRYKVRFYPQTEWRKSILVKEWKGVEDTAQLRKYNRQVDYSWMVKDPYMIGVFWFANRVDEVNQQGMILGRINLGEFH